ncbi:VOC family protein [Variovorax sp. HJSM1_2]|uniref:VOC family protein n=1 Tax=Variovorax sp. HJSM1_2 TaxID=3366263 RepID=UPI003BE125F2
MKVQTYLFFDGRCEEALNFYKTVLGAEIQMMMRFKDNPEPGAGGEGCGPGVVDGEKIMHANFQVGETQVMASDGNAAGKPVFQGFSLSLNPANEAEAERLFKALGEGGQVQMPLSKTFFAKSFGMLADKFGVGWMVIVE